MIFTGLKITQNTFLERCTEEELLCTIGKHALENPYLITACQHLFCRHCLAQEIQKSESLSCPSCHRRIKRDDIIFSDRDNKRLKRVWDKTHGGDQENPYDKNLGNDKETIFGSVDFYDYEPVSMNIKCRMDSFSAEGKHFKGKIDARDGINLKHCMVEGPIKTSMGILKANSCVFKNKITAQDGVTLEKVSCQSVKVSMGKICAYNSTIKGKLKAQDGIQLVDTTAQSVKVSMGKVIVNNQGLTAPAEFMSVEARDDIELRSTFVSGKTTSKMENIEAYGCKLGAIEANNTVKLSESSAKSITFNTSKRLESGLFEARLELDGDIEGNVSVVVNNIISDLMKLVRGHIKIGCSSFSQSISSGNKILNQYSTSCASSIQVGSRKLETRVTETVFNNGRQAHSYYDLKLEGASYPLSSADINLIRTEYPEPLDISSDGVITNTYGKNIKIGNQIIKKEGPKKEGPLEKKNDTPKCILKISGRGIIKGKVDFENCQGEIVKDSSVVIENNFS